MAIEKLQVIYSVYIDFIQSSFNNWIKINSELKKCCANSEVFYLCLG
jgi:hypothetical protein